MKKLAEELSKFGTVERCEPAEGGFILLLTGCDLDSIKTLAAINRILNQSIISKHYSKVKAVSNTSTFYYIKLDKNGSHRFK